jgi:hypothetical protein
MLLMAIVAGLVGVAGCGTAKLDTGYEPRKLGTSDAMRRSYYAPAFTPESQVSDLDKPDYLRKHSQQ